MVIRTIERFVCLMVVVSLVGGCVSNTPLSVAPGAGKSYADLERDDAACRAAAAGAATASTTAQPTTYYQCMSARGEMVIANRPVAYPAYAGYPYPYPFYGYPYSTAYLAPYVGFGIGIGIGSGHYHGGGWHGGYHGGGRGVHGSGPSVFR